MRAGAVLVLVAAAAVCGCNPKDVPASAPDVPPREKAMEPRPAPKGGVTADGLPWTQADAQRKLKGMTKEQVVALFGKPSEVWSTFYYYDEQKYLKADAGDRDQRPGGMSIQFNGETVDLVLFRRR